MVDPLHPVRWLFDVCRGYARTAEMREGCYELLSTYAGDPELAGSALVSVRLIGDARHAPGPCGLGARLAVSAEQLEALKVAAGDARAEGLGVELGGGGEA